MIYAGLGFGARLYRAQGFGLGVSGLGPVGLIGRFTV